MITATSYDNQNTMRETGFFCCVIMASIVKFNQQVDLPAMCGSSAAGEVVWCFIVLFIT